jgi:hypothetical protein
LAPVTLEAAGTRLAPPRSALKPASALAFTTAKLTTIAIASAKLITVASAELVPLAATATITVAAAETIRPATTQTVTLASAELFATAEFVASAEIFPPAEFRSTEFFASATLASAQHAEHGEPPLLAVVEALVERVGSVRQFLQRSTGFQQDLRTPTQALGQIHVIALLALTARNAECLDALEALHREFARRLFEGRPIALLLRRQHETRAQRAQPRFRESTHILDIRLPAPQLRTALALLRIDQRGTRNHESSGTGKDGF